MTGPDQTPGGRGEARPCPICGAPSTHQHRPFCSRRCADVDLARWLNGRYAIPARETDDDDPRASTPAPADDV